MALVKNKLILLLIFEDISPHPTQQPFDMSFHADSFFNLPTMRQSHLIFLGLFTSNYAFGYFLLDDASCDKVWREIITIFKIAHGRTH
jgi:hypothetical protein